MTFSKTKILGLPEVFPALLRNYAASGWPALECLEAEIIKNKVKLLLSKINHCRNQWERKIPLNLPIADLHKKQMKC